MVAVFFAFPAEECQTKNESPLGTHSLNIFHNFMEGRINHFVNGMI